MKRVAAVTICAINYLAKALVLYESYLRHHPGHSFYIIMVDRKTDSLSIDRPNLSLVWAEDLPIDGFLRYAFAFDLIELSTNVKPAVLKMLLVEHDMVVYLDPDVQVFSGLDSVFDTLADCPIVVTPHSNTPILDGCKPDDLDFLRFGVFNLGFIGVSRCDEAAAFLDWWSERCLKYGFYEPQIGLAVDQKWVNLAPAYFPGTKILSDIGLNVAFWNLHERRLTPSGGHWLVNGQVPLRFVHFSSFNASTPDVVAYKQSRYPAGSRPDFGAVARGYAECLLAERTETFEIQKYGFDYFDDGAYVTPALRRFYAAMMDKFSDVVNPFDPKGRIRRFANKRGLLSRRNLEAKRNTFQDMNKFNLQRRVLAVMFRFALFVLGPNRYYMLMKYMAHTSSLMNQAHIFRKID